MNQKDHELFVSLLAKHEPMIRGMIRAGVRLPGEVDDVMQRVSILAWRKFEDLDTPDAFPKWACAIARFEILRFHRERARDRLQFNEKLVDLLATESAEEVSIRNRRIAHLEHCLEKLPDDRRELVLLAYQPETSIKELAKSFGRKPDALYQLLRRIRLSLMLCIERRLAAEGGAA